MKILPCSTVHIQSLLNAILVNENNVSYVCTGVGFSLDDHQIMIDLADAGTMREHSSISFDSIKDWSIQFSSRG